MRLARLSSFDGGGDGARKCLQLRWPAFWLLVTATAAPDGTAPRPQDLHWWADLDESEAAAYAYFGKRTPHGMAEQVPRYSNLTQDQFEELALRGRPFVVEDGGIGQPFVGWDCERFRREFPEGVVKIEYIQAADTTRPFTTDWSQELHAIPRSDPVGPQYAPWYWGVKGADDPQDAPTVFTGPQSPLPRVQASLRLPPFMAKTEENRQEVLGSPEFWFAAPQAGAAMHMDAHCESTYAIQLSGTRRWRAGWVPPVPKGVTYKDGTYSDGAVYGKKYAPPLEAMVTEGQAFFMPSGFLHETTNVGDSCAVSLTFQFRDPVPAGYFRQSLRHLRRSRDFKECFGLLKRVASMGGKSEPNVADHDKDGDGAISLEEATTGPASGRPLRRASHAFYDTDGDGMVTAAELAEGWAAWKSSENEARVADKKRLRPDSFAYVERRQPYKAEL